MDTVGHDPIHLDHNATTPVAPEAAEAMWPYLMEHFGNPSSTTPAGARARAAVDRAREQVAAVIGARPDEIVFTSGGTEANNLAIRGVAGVASCLTALTSSVEHPATQAPLAHLRDQGWRVHDLPVDTQSRVQLGEIPTAPVALGTLILAHNETGAIQPVADFAERVRAAVTSSTPRRGSAPSSSGEARPSPPFLRGALQEGGIRPGTENVPGIVALGAAAELADSVLDHEADRQAVLREWLWERLSRSVPDLIRVPPVNGCLPNALMVVVPRRLGAGILEATPGLAAATGSACHSGVHSPSSALLAMGIEHDTALGSLRLSLGRSTTSTDIERAADALVAEITVPRRPAATAR